MTRYWIDSFSIQRPAKLFYKIVANVGSKVAEFFFARVWQQEIYFECYSRRQCPNVQWEVLVEIGSSCPPLNASIGLFFICWRCQSKRNQSWRLWICLKCTFWSYSYLQLWYVLFKWHGGIQSWVVQSKHRVIRHRCWPRDTINGLPLLRGPFLNPMTEKQQNSLKLTILY